MWRTLTVALLLTWSSWTGARAANLKMLPAEVAMSGPRGSQQLLVLAVTNGNVTGDLTARATFSSSNPAIASVDETGMVRAVGDGATNVTASLDGGEVAVKVKVSKSKEPSAPSFRNDVIPLLTKIGCNSGACHGALAGKGGFKLSLRGYAPLTDHFVMTRQALGRRVNLREPARSLVLLKPTLAVPHGGGQKLEVGSSDYQAF